MAMRALLTTRLQKRRLISIHAAFIQLEELHRVTLLRVRGRRGVSSIKSIRNTQMNVLPAFAIFNLVGCGNVEIKRIDH